MPKQSSHSSPILCTTRTNARGQGIVEYAGAILVATTVIVASILAVPPSYNDMFTAVLDNVSEQIMPE